MKKIRILKKKLYEDNNQTNPNNQLSSGNNSTSSNNSDNEQKIQYVGSLKFDTESDYTKAVARTYATDLAKLAALFKVKLTSNFGKDIFFPSAPTQLASLMCATSMPEKFQNIYSSYDNNPLKTISEAEDLAYKYFNVFVPLQEDDTNESESFYYGNNVLNEVDAGTAVAAAAGGAQVGFEIGKGATVGAGALAGGVGGFLAGFMPPMIASYFGGRMIGGRGSDHGSWIYNDKELHKKYSDETKQEPSTQDVIHAAINNYVNDLLAVLEQGLSHITSGYGDKDTQEFCNAVVEALNTRSKAAISTFIADNNERIKKAKDELIEKLQRFKKHFSDKEKRVKVITSAILNGKIALSSEDVAHYLQSDNKISPLGNEAIKAYENKLDKEIRDDVAESLTYSINNVLNEASENVETQITFDADELYGELQTLFRKHMIKILSSDPNKWEIVETARKQMTELRDGASAEIKTSIEHVCRMANSDQLGMGGKLTAFISKHPMRAAKLTNLWKRHETDLNFRIELRIKQITELDGKGPLKMAKLFYKNTIPNLLAMMITYKTIYNLYCEAKLNVPDMVLGNEEDDTRAKQAVERAKNNYPSLIALEFSKHSNKINVNNKAVYDIVSNTFTQEDLTYLIPFLQGLMPGNQFTPVLMQKLLDLNNELIGYYNGNQVNEFFSRLTDFMIVDCDITDLVDVSAAINRSLNNIVPDDINALLQLLDVPKIVDLPVSKIVYAYAMETDGEIILQYEGVAKTLKIDNTSDSIKAAKDALHISDIQIDDIDHVATLFNKAAAYFSSIDPTADENTNITNFIRAYYTLELYKLKTINMNPFKLIRMYITMCQDLRLRMLFGKDADNAAYLELQKLWLEKTENQDAWNNYIAAITFGENEYKEYTTKGLLLENENQFVSFCHGLTAKSGGLENLKSGSDFDAFCTDAEQYKEAQPLPGGMNSWDAICKGIITNNTYPSILALMNIDDLDKVTFGPTGIQLLKQLLLYIVKIRAIDFKKMRDDSKIFDELWLHGHIHAGDNELTLLKIITLLRLLINNSSDPKIANPIKNCVKHADEDLQATLKDKVVGDFFNIMLYDDKVEYKDGYELLSMLKAKLLLNNKPIDAKENKTAFNDYIIALCEFISNPDKSRCAKLFALASEKAPKKPVIVNTNNRSNSNVAESYLFFGMSMYDMLTEAEGSMEEFLNTQEGQAWLNNLASDDMSQLLTGLPNENDESVNNAVSDENKNAAEMIHQAAKQQEDTLKAQQS